MQAFVLGWNQASRYAGFAPGLRALVAM